MGEVYRARDTKLGCDVAINSFTALAQNSGVSRVRPKPWPRSITPTSHILAASRPSPSGSVSRVLLRFGARKPSQDFIETGTLGLLRRRGIDEAPTDHGRQTRAQLLKSKQTRHQIKIPRCEFPTIVIHQSQTYAHLTEPRREGARSDLTPAAIVKCVVSLAVGCIPQIRKQVNHQPVTIDAS
jgi:hypothetical protein